jgi:nitroimidazol reductase NimA-like FMN-containing flavoprotein (pyridoxamine 5'-phosphate oxidase superfamily)
MNDFPKTALNQIHRHPDRGHYDKSTIYPIIDESLVCHVGFVQEGQPFVIPTFHARDGDQLYLHGSKASRLLRHIVLGNPICVEFTLLDGIIFARSAFEHSLNFRSVVLFGHGKVVDSVKEKFHALELLTEQLARGRWKETRQPNQKELDTTMVVVITIENASAKLNNNTPSDNPDDLLLPFWAGVLPLRIQASEPIQDPRVPDNVQVPPNIGDYRR